LPFTDATPRSNSRVKIEIDAADAPGRGEARQLGVRCLTDIRALPDQDERATLDVRSQARRLSVPQRAELHVVAHLSSARSTPAKGKSD